MYEIKNLPDSVLDVTSRRVKVAISEVESLDLDNEIIAKGAYSRTVSQRGPMGSKSIWHLTDHNASLKFAVGKPLEMGMEGNKLYMVTDIPETSWGNDVFKMYDSGLITEHSVGFATIKDEKPKKEGDPRILTEVKLYEGSAVLWGANPNTPTLSVGKNFKITDENRKEFDFILEEYKIIKRACKGNFSDETAELIEAKANMLEQRLVNIFNELCKSTQPATSALDPDNKLMDEIHLLLIKHF